MSFKVCTCKDGGFEIHVDNDSFQNFLLRKISEDQLIDLRDQINKTLEESHKPSEK